ncbi:MAG TPA: 16S rRNA (adenine(1518)-N(6)/adenine(1519)-N(6))-dimethyltransferase RsmA [Terriglobales bacterium]|nr:16S rRNA (adenine(1518)-N(6)/adenine(1519)-N(6))-dimethyltransferase RsmA [Terriglobales bacterium]
MTSTRAVNAGGRAGKKPKLGQNFLVDANAAKNIVEALGDVSQRMVIEIGPGKGAITKLLAQRAGKLIAIEFDRQLTAGLRMEYLTRKHVEILEADVLSVDFDTLVRGALHGVTDFTQTARPTADVVGNLPYYITSDILLKLFRFHVNFREIVIMVQREVADRIAATAGSRDYGVLTVTTQLYAQVENLFTLPPSAFAPPPRVHSTVLRLRIAPRFDELQVQPEKFMAFVKSAFAQKRKTLVNNLKPGFAEAQTKEALKDVGARADVRAEAMSLEQLAAVYKALSK